MPKARTNEALAAHCPVCDAAAHPHRALCVIVWRCPACGTRFLRDTPSTSVAALDEAARRQALEPLRRDNARRVLRRLQGLVGARPRLLDVGCAHGWFVLEAQRAGFEAEGIDPDGQAIAHARGLGARVRAGRFPEDVEDVASFDVLTFNDVFEHLPSPRAMLAHSLRRLAPGGVLVLNLPSRHGLLYHVAEALAVAGVRAPLERLYQLSFPSPHLFYFGEAGLRVLARAAGLRLLARQRLPVLPWRTLSARLRMDPSGAPLRRWATAVALFALLPLLRAWPRSDVEAYYFGRAAELR